MSAPMAISIDARADWMTSAAHVIGALATEYRRSGKTFTADDLHENKLMTEPENANWPGQAFTEAQSRGEIIQTQIYVPSKRKGRKGSRIAVWRAAT